MTRATHYILLSMISIVLLGFASTSIAADEKARKIMELVDARDTGDNQTAELEMILIDNKGKQRIRKMHLMSKDFGNDSKRIMFFLLPADVKNTGFLIYDYDAADKDDEQWLYLPKLRKSKRISSSDKSSSFMGSDFTYADMTTFDLKDYDYILKKEMEMQSVPVWVVESIPRTEKVIKETGYTKSLLFIRKDNYVVTRAINWIEQRKNLKYMDMKGLKLINNIWTPTEIHMTTKKGKITLHKTILKFSDVKYNQDLNANQFSIRQLEKGL